MSDKTPDKTACDFCADFRAIAHIHARCHPSAPLRAELENGKLTLYCYLPSCNRRVVCFTVSDMQR